MVDVMFAIPDQAGIEGTDYCVSFLETIVSKSQVNAEQVRVGVTPSTCDRSDAIALEDDDSVLIHDLESRRLSSCQTDKHLRSIRNMAAADADRRKMALIIIDNKSRSSSDTRREAERAKALGVRVIVIGVGSRVDQSTREISRTTPHALSYLTC